MTIAKLVENSLLVYIVIADGSLIHPSIIIILKIIFRRIVKVPRQGLGNIELDSL